MQPRPDRCGWRKSSYCYNLNKTVVFFFLFSCWFNNPSPMQALRLGYQHVSRISRLHSALFIFRRRLLCQSQAVSIRQSFMSDLGCSLVRNFVYISSRVGEQNWILMIFGCQQYSHRSECLERSNTNKTNMVGDWLANMLFTGPSMFTKILASYLPGPSQSDSSFQPISISILS